MCFIDRIEIIDFRILLMVSKCNGQMFLGYRCQDHDRIVCSQYLVIMIKWNVV